MKKTFVVSSAIAIALLAGLSSVPQVRSFVHGLIPSLGIEGAVAATGSDPIASLELGDSREFLETNIAAPDKELTGQLVDIDQSTSSSTELATATHSTSEETNPHILLAQSTEPARTLNAVQTSPSKDRVTKLSSFEQVPNEGVLVPAVPSSGILIDSGATLVFVNDITVPAQADGIITNLQVDEGSIVRKGDPIYQLDPRLANAEISVQSKELEQAKLKYEDDSNLEFSKLAHKVAVTEYQISNNLVTKQAEDEMTNKKKALEAEKARLQVVVSEMEKRKDLTVVGVSEAKLDAAKVQLELRSFVAPWDGIVSELKNRQSAYVRAGEPILQLTDMRKIRVKGQIDVSTGTPPHLVLNSPARVIIEVAPGVEEAVEGTVGYVSPSAKIANKYPYWIEIDNRLLPDGQYLFRGVMKARVEIQPRRQ
ncbi:MAG: HlyD family efflux transporter periplasmic adaptor subunit [Pirellula sp.]|jgi:multidrug efflux pump subunit AcrA (membrane-fusion protein)|nr:HlyD family efflux transporter periplasmic adaptor subunit [Pirellula sp.]